MYYGFDKDVMGHDQRRHRVPARDQGAADGAAAKELIDASWTDEILKKANLKVPLAKIEAQDPSKYPGGKITLPASWRKD